MSSTAFGHWSKPIGKMHAVHLRILPPLILSLVALAAGYGSGHRSTTSPQLIGFDSYIEQVGYFEATQLVRLDPVTLRRLPGRPLRLHDHANSWVLGPDGRTLALAGYNYGEVIFVDLRRLARIARVQVVPRKPGESIGVDVVSWPRPNRMLVVVWPAQDGPDSSRLVVLDPVRRRVLRLVSLGGEALSWLRITRNRAVFLVGGRTGQLASARLVVADPDGRTRTGTLSRILAGVGGGGHGSVVRMPALASDGRRALVVGGQEPIASVDLQTLHVDYHEVPRVMAAHLPLTPPGPTGSGGQQLELYRGASWLGNGKLLVTGDDSFPAPHGLERGLTHAATIVDTRTWRVVHVFQGISTLRPVSGVLLGSGVHWVGKHEVGPSLVAFRLDGTPLYRKPQSDLSWSILAGRLIVSKSDGSRLAELSPRSGRLIRRLPRSTVLPDDALLWTPRAARG